MNDGDAPGTVIWTDQGFVWVSRTSFKQVAASAAVALFILMSLPCATVFVAGTGAPRATLLVAIVLSGALLLYSTWRVLRIPVGCRLELRRSSVLFRQRHLVIDLPLEHLRVSQSEDGFLVLGESSDSIRFYAGEDSNWLVNTIGHAKSVLESGEALSENDIVALARLMERAPDSS